MGMFLPRHQLGWTLALPTRGRVPWMAVDYAYLAFRSGPGRIFVLAFSAILGLSIAVSRFSCRLSHRRWEFNLQGLDS